MGVIPKDSLIECPWCHREFSADIWNDTTYLECYTREMRRAYIPIYNTKVFGRNSDSFYKCPSCGQWTRGNKLRITHSTDTSLEGLGGIPIIEETTEQTTE